MIRIIQLLLITAVLVSCQQNQTTPAPTPASSTQTTEQMLVGGQWVWNANSGIKWVFNSDHTGQKFVTGGSGSSFCWQLTNNDQSLEITPGCTGSPVVRQITSITANTLFCDLDSPTDTKYTK